MNDVSSWYYSIPVITRVWFTLSAVIPLLGRFGFYNPFYMILNRTLVFQQFQLWRPITALFYFPVAQGTGFHWLITLYFLYNYSKRLEDGYFSGKQADYLVMLIFNWVVCTSSALAMNIPLLLEPMVLSVLYVWCQLNPDVMISFYFGTMFKAIYLPWVLALFNMIMGPNAIVDLIGILAGHAYYFLAFQHPIAIGGRSLIKTPKFLHNLFQSGTNQNNRGFVHSFSTSHQSSRNNQRQFFTGTGHRLDE